MAKGRTTPDVSETAERERRGEERFKSRKRPQPGVPRPQKSPAAGGRQTPSDSRTPAKISATNLPRRGRSKFFRERTTQVRRSQPHEGETHRRRDKWREDEGIFSFSTNLARSTLLHTPTAPASAALTVSKSGTDASTGTRDGGGPGALPPRTRVRHLLGTTGTWKGPWTLRTRQPLGQPLNSKQCGRHAVGEKARS